MTPRHLRFGIEARQIDLGKDVRVWIRASEQIAVFLQDERSVEFRCAGNDEFRSGPGRMRQRTRRTDSRERLARSAVRTEDIVDSDAPAAKTAIDRQIGRASWR